MRISRNRNSPCRVQGFTLLEVMIALAIFAVVSVMCYRQVDTTFRLAQRMEQKYVALWLAESELEELFSLREWSLTAGNESKEIEGLAGHWTVNVNANETDIPNLRKVEISVSVGEGDQSSPVLTVTRFMSKF